MRSVALIRVTKCVTRPREATRASEASPTGPEHPYSAAPSSDRFDDDFKVEYDWANSPVLAASMDGKPEKEKVEAVLKRPEGVVDLFSRKQRRLLTEAGSPPGAPCTGLRALGSVAALRWEDVATHGLDGLRVARWTYGHGKTFLELSLRTQDLERARQSRDVLLSDLAADDLAPDPGAPPKTEAVIRDLLGEPE